MYEHILEIIALYLFLVLYYYIVPIITIFFNFRYKLDSKIFRYVLRVCSIFISLFVLGKTVHCVRVFKSIFACGPYTYPTAIEDIVRFDAMVVSGKIMMPEVLILILEIVLILIPRLKGMKMVFTQ